MGHIAVVRQLSTLTNRKRATFTAIHSGLVLSWMLAAIYYQKAYSGSRSGEVRFQSY